MGNSVVSTVLCVWYVHYNHEYTTTVTACRERKKEGRREKRVKEKQGSKRKASWEKYGLSTEVGR